jgi:mRNA interferase MazF
MSDPSRGEIWWVKLDPVVGHEQGGRRPALVITVDAFNRGPAGLVTVVPITTKDKGIPIHVRVEPPEGGLSEVSFVKPEDVRSVSKKRLDGRLGRVTETTMADVGDNLRVLLGLS